MTKKKKRSPLQSFSKDLFLASHIGAGNGLPLQAIQLSVKKLFFFCVCAFPRLEVRKELPEDAANSYGVHVNKPRPSHLVSLSARHRHPRQPKLTQRSLRRVGRRLSPLNTL